MSETAAGPSKPLPSLIVVNNIKRELDRARDEGLLPAVEDKRARTRKFLRKYGVGMVVGYIVVDWTAQKLKKLPLVGRVLGGILGALAPIAGPALGAGVAYGLHQGDVYAATHKVKEGASYLNNHARGIHDHLKQELPKIEAKAKEGTARVSEGVKEGARAISEAAKEGARKLSAAGREPGSGTASEGK